MSEGLKEARQRLVREFDDAMPQECGLLRSEKKLLGDMLRELQKQAMELAIRRVAAVQIKHGLGGLHVEAFSAAELDWLLDEPPPHFPPRCIHCGQIAEAHAIVAHEFEAQSPRCHRAHPHQEPCA